MMSEALSVPRLRFPEFRDVEAWGETSIGQLGDVITGSTPSTAHPAYYGGDRMFVSPADISYGRFIEKTKTTLTALGFKETRPVKANSILFVCIGSIGKIAQNQHECATNQQINSVVPNSNNAAGFVYYALSGMANIANLAGRQVIPIINKSLFSSVELLVPKLPEQQKIAECLTSIDDLITAEAQKLDALKTHKKGLMQQLFPRQGEVIPRLRFPEFRDAKGWSKKNLGDCLSRHPEYGINAPAVPFSRNLPTYLRITDISEEGHFQKKTKVSVAKTVGEENYLLKGDIALARTGASVGKSYRYKEVDGRLVFAGFLIRVRTDENKLLSELLIHFFSTTQYWRWVDFISARSGQPGINGNEYTSLPVPLPPSMEEQQKIAECLTSIDDLITAEAQKLDALKTHKKGLMQQLFPTSDEVKV